MFVRPFLSKTVFSRLAYYYFLILNPQSEGPIKCPPSARFNFVELFIKITCKFVCETKSFGKYCSKISFLPQG